MPARPSPLAVLTKVTVATVEEVLLSDLLATKLTLHLPSLLVTLVIFFWFVTIDIFFWFVFHCSPLLSHG
jgi:hypothetical protein